MVEEPQWFSGYSSHVLNPHGKKMFSFITLSKETIPNYCPYRYLISAVFMVAIPILLIFADQSHQPREHPFPCISHRPHILDQIQRGGCSNVDLLFLYIYNFSTGIILMIIDHF